MTEQEAFDRAAAGLASQGYRQSLASSGDCAYNGADGLHCAVGWLIEGLPLPADLNTGYSVSHLMGDGEYPVTECAERLAGLPLGFLEDLQAAHDNSTTPGVMIAALRDFAERRGLRHP